MLIWKRVDERSRDIRLINPEAFDRERYTQLLKDFRISAAHVDHRLLTSLKKLGEEPENTVLPCRQGSLRVGYIGLNRWCVTKGSKFQKGVWTACSLWTFLFGERTPTQLADAPPGGKGEPVLNEMTWDEWYNRISQRI